MAHAIDTPMPRNFREAELPGAFRASELLPPSGWLQVVKHEQRAYPFIPKKGVSWDALANSFDYSPRLYIYEFVSIAMLPRRWTETAYLLYVVSDMVEHAKYATTVLFPVVASLHRIESRDRRPQWEWFVKAGWPQRLHLRDGFARLGWLRHHPYTPLGVVLSPNATPLTEQMARERLPNMPASAIYR